MILSFLMDERFFVWLCRVISVCVCECGACELNASPRDVIKTDEFLSGLPTLVMSVLFVAVMRECDSC